MPYSSGADLDAEDRITFRLEGTPIRGEKGAALAASHVVERLNAEGGQWSQMEVTGRDARHEKGIDVTFQGVDGTTLEIQVTAAERGLWKQLQNDNVVEGAISIDSAVEALWQATTEKRTRSDPRVVLVLDAANMGQFIFDPVIRRFHELHGGDAGRVGFSQIWLAGPTAERTLRLDVE